MHTSLLRRCVPFAGTSFPAIREGRQQLAQQFATMDGWQRGENPRFDDYVQEKRQQEHFDAMDQRVERAYRVALKIHKQEVINGFKRRLTTAGSDGNGNKFTAAVMREMNTAVEERAEWLRDVFVQIDADYRSGDHARHEKAAKEISDAINGNPSDFIAFVYDKKRERRFLGEKGLAAMDAEMEEANLPQVSDDEANRYHALKTDMLELERNVKGKFGLAGQRHWAELQREKDLEYDRKLESAEETYKMLLKQDERYETMRATMTTRNFLERRHLAQVRFKGAMELEKEREKLIEAHRAMEKERFEQNRQESKAKLAEIARMRREGKPTEEILEQLKREQLDAQIIKSDSYRQQERTVVTAKRAKFLDLIDKLKTTFESRDGERAMQMNQTKENEGELSLMLGIDQTRPRAAAMSTTTASADHFPENGAAGEEADLAVLQAADALARKGATARNDDIRGGVHPDELAVARKQALWQLVNADRHEDPFRTVHQARLDAAKTHSQFLARSNPVNFALGSKKVSKQTMGENRPAGKERTVLKSPEIYAQIHSFSPSQGPANDLDPTVEYGLAPLGTGIRDPKTWEFDDRYQKRRGAPALRGPRFYKLGEEHEAKDPGNWSVYAAPKKVGGVNPPKRSE